MLRKIFFLTETRGRQEGGAGCVGVDRWASKNPRARLRGCEIRPLDCHGWRGGGEGLDFIRPFLAMASLKACQLWRCSFGLTKRLDFIRPFLAMASLKSSRLWASSFGLTKRFPRRPILTARLPVENRCYVKNITSYVKKLTSYVKFFT